MPITHKDTIINLLRVILPNINCWLNYFSFQLQSQQNKLKIMLLIIQKMYWESEFVTTREAEQAVNCDLSNQCTNKLLVLINMIKRRFLHHRYKIHFQTKLVAQFLPTNFFFCSYCDKGFENEDILKDHNSGRVKNQTNLAVIDALRFPLSHKQGVFLLDTVIISR